MAEYAVGTADIRAIQSGLVAISGQIVGLDNKVEFVDAEVGRVKSNVSQILEDLATLAKDFYAFVDIQMKANALSKAQQRVIQIRQEAEKKFGHYDEVRRRAVGILQANDIGVVKKETITNAAEELMLTTPGYWLAPCLVALAAWISDQPELAERALMEGIKRNDEKTSLFFSLVCRRADRKSASLKWTKRYLANQDEENLDRNAIVIIDAYVSGLLGADTEGVVSEQMAEWLDKLVDKPGFVESQTEQWSAAILQKRVPISEDAYPYLRKYSKTWPALEDVMEGAHLHAEILSYFTAIFDQEVPTDSLKERLDRILDDLVSDYDVEEIPLRKEEKYNQFIIDYSGDVDRADQSMAVEESAFEERKDFAQLLTDAAMKPESSNASVSTQKFAIALSKEWVGNAYNDVIAKNRMKIPNEIEIHIDTFNDKTTDGKDEDAVIGRFNQLIDNEKKTALSSVKITIGDIFALISGGVTCVIGLLMIFAEGITLQSELLTKLLGVVALLIGLGLGIRFTRRVVAVKKSRKNISDKFEQKRTNGSQIIRATLAEVVDFRAEFAQRDSESQKVVELLDELTPDQYVVKLSDSTRRLKIR